MFTCTPANEIQSKDYGCPCHSPAFARLNSLVTSEISRRSFLRGASAAAATVAFWPGSASASMPQAPKSPLAFTNIKVFDGKSDKLLSGFNVLVQGNKINAVETSDRPLGDGVQVIDCGGRALMPGLIDAHWHTMIAGISLDEAMTADVGYINLVAGEEAGRTLTRGFTSVRDMGGPSFGLKRAVDAGIIPGPRIWPSGAAISQTGGHGDHRQPYEINSRSNSPASRSIADGADAVLTPCASN